MITSSDGCCGQMYQGGQKGGKTLLRERNKLQFSCDKLNLGKVILNIKYQMKTRQYTTNKF